MRSSSKLVFAGEMRSLLPGLTIGRGEMSSESWWKHVAWLGGSMRGRATEKYTQECHSFEQ